MEVTGYLLLTTVVVRARPATYSTVREADWKAAVAAGFAAAEFDTPSPSARFAARIEVDLPAPARAGEAWDIDNLAKPILDSMELVFGRRAMAGRPQPNDDRVDHLEVLKHTATSPEGVCATVDVWVLPDAGDRPAPHPGI